MSDYNCYVHKQIGLSVSNFGDLQMVSGSADQTIACQFGLSGSVTMPCGEKFVLDKILELNGRDLPCSCGDPSHWFVRFE